MNAADDVARIKQSARMVRRAGSPSVLVVAALALAGLGVASAANSKLVLFNHSPSIPIGFYLISSQAIERGTIVTVLARDVAPMEAIRRHYAGDDDRFIKRVAAVAGQLVCSDGHTLRIDGSEAAHVFVGSGRANPKGWVGCRRLAAGEILLLGDSADSFDGRYWGPTSTRFVTGVWRHL